MVGSGHQRKLIRERGFSREQEVVSELTLLSKAMLPNPQTRRTRILCELLLLIPLTVVSLMGYGPYPALCRRRSTMMCRFFAAAACYWLRTDFFGVWSRTFYYQRLRRLLGGERPAGLQFLSYVARFELRSSQRKGRTQSKREEGRTAERARGV